MSKINAFKHIQKTCDNGPFLKAQIAALPNSLISAATVATIATLTAILIPITLSNIRVKIGFIAISIISSLSGLFVGSLVSAITLILIDKIAKLDNNKEDNSCALFFIFIYAMNLIPVVALSTLSSYLTRFIFLPKISHIAAKIFVVAIPTFLSVVIWPQITINIFPLMTKCCCD